MKMRYPQLFVCRSNLSRPAALAAVGLAAAALAGCAQGSGSSMGGPGQDPSATSESRSGARQPRPADQANPRMGADNAAGDASGSPGGNP